MSTSSNKKPRQRGTIAEILAGIGMIMVVVALIVPIFNLLNAPGIAWCKWVYAAGAVSFTAARCIPVGSEDDSYRMRRLRRMEAWAGFAFIIGAACWFYNEERLGIHAGTLAIIRPTVILSLAGAAIQIASSIMLSRQIARETIEKRP